MRRVVIVLVALVAVLSTATWATAGFVNPPPFTPQRQLEWTFDSAGWETPVTVVGPVWDSPGWTCDDIAVTGAVQWYASYGGHNGVVGIDNTGGTPGTAPLTGSIVFHVNNYDRPWPLKLIWDEAVYMTGVGFEIKSKTDPVASQANNTQLGDGWVRNNVSGRIEPNPTWEEFVWTFSVDPGQALFLDSYKVATACVPVPSAICTGMALLGAMGMARCFRCKHVRV